MSLSGAPHSGPARPGPTAAGSGTLEALLRQRRTWETKPALRALYGRWYERIVAALAERRPVVEIGAGSGNFKGYFPEAVATDRWPVGPWIDRVVDATELPFAPGEVGNFVLVDCLHHLHRPVDFLADAARALQPGGRIVLLEPAATPWARLVWRLFHHEPVDLEAELLAPTGPGQHEAAADFANMGTAEVLFRRRPAATMRRLPGLRLRRLELSDFLVYPATGGMSHPSLIPARLVRPLHRLEGWLTRPTAAWLTGLRMLVVLEREA